METSQLKGNVPNQTHTTPKVETVNRVTSTQGSMDILERMKETPEYIPTLQENTIIHAIEAANQKLQGEDRVFEFSVHAKTKQIMVKILNRQTKEVIREIPSEKILDLVANLCEMAGIFVDEKR